MAARNQGCGQQHRGAQAHWHHLVVVVVLLVELLGPDMLPLEPVLLLLVSLPELELPGDVLEEPLVPGPPIELVLPLLPLLPLLSLLLLPMPAVLLLPGDVLELPDGLVVVLDELEVLGVPPSRLLQAPSERAATTVRAAAAH